jgi:flagellar hook-associated protein 3 FlgL
MAILPLGTDRVSSLMHSMLTSQQIDGTQSELTTLENELSTGLAVSQPSDNPSAAAVIMQLQQTLTRTGSYSDTINSTTAQLSQSDSSLGTLTNLLQQAQQIASADVGSTTTPSQRQADVAVVQSIYNQALSIANQTYNGQYLFGNATGGSNPFVESNGTVQYTGPAQTLTNQVGDNYSLTFQVNGAAVFGSLTSSVVGSTNVSPSLTPQTRLSDLGGANNMGVMPGLITVSNGTVTKSVDLSAASSIGDVVSLINQAGVGTIAASITGQGLTLTGGATENIVVTGQPATDLGIATPPTGEGVGTPVTGSSVNPKVTAITPLSTLNDGAGLDSSGLVISNGGVPKTITWPAGGTVQDLLDAVNGAGLGVNAQINSAGTGINVVNITQGTSLSIGENGGQSAAQLGLQTLSATTQVSQLNKGAGLQTAGGTTPDFQITARDGTVIPVALGSPTTVQDVLNTINGATGGKVVASLATTGSGIVLTDTTGGTGTLSVTSLNNSSAANQLGLTTTASGATLTGTDTGAQTSTGVFANLQALMNSLQSGNIQGITAAGGGISTDTQRVINYQGQAGAVEKSLTSQQTSLVSQNTATNSLLSQLQDADYATVITQYTTLQTALQASLETAAQSSQISLLNYL